MASVQECHHIQGILSAYEVASSQQLSRERTIMFFSKSTPQVIQDSIIDLLGVPKNTWIYLLLWVKVKKPVLCT